MKFVHKMNKKIGTMICISLISSGYAFKYEDSRCLQNRPYVPIREPEEIRQEMQNPPHFPLAVIPNRNAHPNLINQREQDLAQHFEDLMRIH